MLAITLGDANGIGPEIVLKAWAEQPFAEDAVVVGDYTALRLCNERLSCGAELHRLTDMRDYRPGRLNVLDAALLTEEQIAPGEIGREVAAASRQYVVTATELANQGIFSAIVTLPVNKEAIRLTDPDFTGHTELIAGLCGQDSYTMMLASKKLTVTHVTTHVSMEEAIRRIQKDRVLDVIRLTQDALARFQKAPRIAVAGLNAHAGEGGAFGRQEIDEIAPAVGAARAAGMDASGPIPPDTVFWRAVRGEFDAVVCMYHDQGHIPMKVLDFEGGVNVTLGLDVVRTSVDHGTAFDIAWKGIASPQSFREAFEYARLIQKR